MKHPLHHTPHHTTMQHTTHHSTPLTAPPLDVHITITVEQSNTDPQTPPKTSKQGVPHLQAPPLVQGVCHVGDAGVVEAGS